MPSSSSLFLLSFCFKNLLLEIFSELEETLRGLFLCQDEDRDRRGALEATHRAGATLARDPTWTRGWDPHLLLGRPLGPLRCL